MLFGVVSDIHAHTWSLFSGIDADGVNTRLRFQLNELERAANEIAKGGGKLLVIPGDIYHTRGSIDPEVHNPLEDTFQKILNMGIDIVAIPGNHDLKSKDTLALSSQVETLGKLFGAAASFNVINERKVIHMRGLVLGFIPWRANPSEVLVDLEILSKDPDAANMYVFMHVGLADVLPLSEGLKSADVESFGFKKVFSGHYHHHKGFNDKVYSVGATAHHSWRDVGTKAGFLLVDGDDVRFRETLAPKFVDISGMTDEDEIRLACHGNYVRIRGAAMSEKEIEDLRTALVGFGAVGVSIEIPKTAPVAHAPAAAAASGKPKTLGESVDDYVLKKTFPATIDAEKVRKRAQQVLLDAQTAYVEA